MYCIQPLEMVPIRCRIRWQGVSNTFWHSGSPTGKITPPNDWISHVAS
jgi:hypothetical protein